MTAAPSPTSPTDPSPASPAEAVDAFLAALQRLDVDTAVSLLAEDATYQNVPLPPARGRAEIERQLRWFGEKASSFEVITHHQAADGPVVLNERTDIIGIGPVRGAFWVCGTFEVHDGLITLWRDRFDPLDVTWSFVRGAASAVRDRLAARRG
jgi:limonene-1,2-epoxide hydrolase